MAGGSQTWWQVIPGLFGVLVGIGIFYFSPAPAPSMINGWREISLTQEQCVQRAEAALKSQGFSRRFEIVGGDSVYGEQRTSVTALIRCVASKRLVYYVIAGGYLVNNRPRMDAIRAQFDVP
ncbi:MAG: hypothetical protein EKK41_10780 [Hyphomicrobiales bacterium]|nr:MAG: hypothetical protein EKK41_10780 [Hyphomicrobiales bacterium]